MEIVYMIHMLTGEKMPVQNPSDTHQKVLFGIM